MGRAAANSLPGGALRRGGLLKRNVKNKHCAVNTFAGMELFLGPRGPFLDCVAGTVFIGAIDRATGEAKQLLISFLVLAYLTNEREEQAWRGTEAVATGGLEWKNPVWSNSTF